MDDEVINQLAELVELGKSITPHDIDNRIWQAHRLIEKVFSKETLQNTIIFKALCRWVDKYQLPEADSNEVKNALEEIRKTNSDLTLDDAKGKIENGNEPPWGIVFNAMNWNQIHDEEYMIAEAYEAASVVKGVLKSGLVQASELGLYLRPMRYKINMVTR